MPNIISTLALGLMFSGCNLNPSLHMHMYIHVCIQGCGQYYIYNELITYPNILLVIGGLGLGLPVTVVTGLLTSSVSLPPPPPTELLLLEERVGDLLEGSVGFSAISSINKEISIFFQAFLCKKLYSDLQLKNHALNSPTH